MPFTTSFADIKCHEGFHCVSAVDVFGLQHDGKWEGMPNGQTTPVRYRGAYEWGCPARGVMSSAGDCVDQGKGPVSYCWSNTRFETGADKPCKDPSMCMCVKDGTEGTGSGESYGVPLTHKSGEVEVGSELLTKTYLVQPEAQCEDCAAHNCNREQCNKCHNCEYGTKVTMGRSAKGCYFRDFGVAKKKRVDATDGRKYLFAGMDGLDGTQQEQRLVVIPHYPLWDPGDERTSNEAGGDEEHAAHNLLFPYQSRREPLSRETWVDNYKQAAPRIQRMMDTTSDNVKEWGPKANDIDCTQDILGRITKVNLFRKECKKMQALENRVAPNTPFESTVPDGKGGFIPVKCIMGGQGMCQGLNCYSDDVDLIKGIDQMKERSKTCRGALGLLVREEEENGPIGDDAEVSARSGGRLEVPLPPPGVKFKEGAAAEAKPAAMPVEVGLAMLAAAGAASTMRRNLAAAVFPTAVMSARPHSRGDDWHGDDASRRRDGRARRRVVQAPEALNEFLVAPPGVEAI